MNCRRFCVLTGIILLCITGLSFATFLCYVCIIFPNITGQSLSLMLVFQTIFLICLIFTCTRYIFNARPRRRRRRRVVRVPRRRWSPIVRVPRRPA